MTVPWVLGEVIQEGEQERNFGFFVACNTPDSVPKRLAPLNAYDPFARNEAGYSDWVTECASEIYPIVGISYVGHKLQLLALLTFLEKERRKGSMVTNSRSGAKGILIMWDNRVVEKVEDCVGDYTLAMSFRDVVDRLICAFAGVWSEF
jgi:hypothetical protein